jgi:hypothetical protein
VRAICGANNFAESENELQNSMLHFNKTCTEYNRKISSKTIKTMVSYGCPVKKNNFFNEQASNFNYLGCDTAYSCDKGINKEFH